MISANELRIGNYVYSKNKGIKKIGIDSFRNVKTFKPIELTEEILLKCGFENPYNEYFELFKDYEYFLSYNLRESKIGIYINNTRGIRYWIECKYLHQLQNLYFALTNQELTINL